MYDFLFILHKPLLKIYGEKEGKRERKNKEKTEI